MQRVVAVLLLALLPLHLSWTAVASYCDLELVPQSQEHFGLHDQTAAAADVLLQSSDDVGAAQDSTLPNCGQCHNQCTGMLLAPAIVQMAGSSEHLSAAEPASAADQVPTPPERPQWARLA